MKLICVTVLILATATAIGQGVNVGVMADSVTGEVKVPSALESRISITETGGAYFPDFFNWTVTQQFAGTPDVITTNTHRDRLIRVTEFDVSETEYIVTLSDIKSSQEMDAVELAVGDETIASVDGNTVSRVTNGTTTVTGSLGAFSRVAQIEMSTISGGTNTLIVGGISNSFREAATTTIDTLIAGASFEVTPVTPTPPGHWPTLPSGGPDRHVYSVWDYAQTNYVRNTNAWAAALDTTAVPAYNSWSLQPFFPDRRFSGNLITPDIIIGTRHASTDLPVGSMLHFVDMTNAVHVRTVTDKIVYDFGSMHPDNLDLHVARLDAPLPESITPMQVLDVSTRAAHVPISPEGIPAVWIDRYSNMHAVEMVTWSQFREPLLDERLPFWKHPVIGDSSSPVMLFDSLEAAPIFVLQLVTTRGGLSIANIADRIMDGIVELGGDTNLTVRTLSEYWTGLPPVPGS